MDLQSSPLKRWLIKSGPRPDCGVTHTHVIFIIFPLKVEYLNETRIHKQTKKAAHNHNSLSQKEHWHEIHATTQADGDSLCPCFTIRLVFTAICFVCLCFLGSLVAKTVAHLAFLTAPQRPCTHRLKRERWDLIRGNRGGEVRQKKRGTSYKRKESGRAVCHKMPH